MANPAKTNLGQIRSTTHAAQEPCRLHYDADAVGLAVQQANVGDYIFHQPATFRTVQHKRRTIQRGDRPNQMLAGRMPDTCLPQTNMTIYVSRDTIPETLKVHSAWRHRVRGSRNLPCSSFATTQRPPPKGTQPAGEIIRERRGTART